MNENKDINKFLHKKELENRKLDNKINNLENLLSKLNKQNDKLLYKLKEEKLRNAILNNRYNILLDEIKERGIVFKIRKNGSRLLEWQNLYFDVNGENVCIRTLDKYLIYEFDNNISSLIKILIRENSYSLIVIRVNEKNVKIQLRITERYNTNRE
ncbi:hypothetical protein [Clostridium felsineum]|uniref:Uncharacterized protein n=1 Tax=Clostridium felsineum TaxID=36839 RepID=A0A1S8LJI2_9CLOT|nr:hypothetical protein [Clostridium felsineum]MCR3760063.1 hypothetical protein [Clostridium felsineum]URZ01397.1 hypothetical protein CLAUR_013870 [Clostridium felsineum]URZ05759.1 hypothetical protein CLROS_010900 [Clostridium felsineum]URZ10798.1 hypothetical protein CROST_015130 [Clostridium felsineum]